MTSFDMAVIGYGRLRISR